ncbi:MAG: sensor domain-containing diguanylate cyclase, partial [bacterium]|nr:sensor domain-containing diguanylate cyclase [bacterium]
MRTTKKRKPGKTPEPLEAPVEGMVPILLKRSTFQLFVATLSQVITETNPANAIVSVWSDPIASLKHPNIELWSINVDNGWTRLSYNGNNAKSEYLPGIPRHLFPGQFAFAARSPVFSFAFLVTNVRNTRDLSEPEYEAWFTTDSESVLSLFAKLKCEVPTVVLGELETEEANNRLILHLLQQFNESHAHKDYRIQWAERLNKFAASIAWELDLSKLLPLATDGFKSAINFDLFELQLFDRDKQRFVEKFTWRRNDTRYGGKLMTMELHPAVLRSIYRHRHPVFVPDVMREELVLNPKLLYITELRTAVLLPLVHERRVHGILKLFFRDPERVSMPDVEWLGEMAELLTRSLANAKIYQVATQLATIDSLTGVHNRRSFNEQLHREFKRVRRFGGDLTLMMVDVDHFKLYNDREGHLQGDLVLRGIADLLKRSVRETDFVTRYGGEEFAIILPGANIEGAGILADKLRSNVEEFDFVNANKQPE